MRFVRILLTAVTLLLAAACADASANSAGVWVRVSPTTITAGYQTQIQASCGESANAATVSSPAFGSVTLQPVAGVLSAKVTVPANTPKGTYDVRLSCPTGSQATTTLTILGTTLHGETPPVIPGPGTGGGFLANEAGGAEAGGGGDGAPGVWVGVGVACLVAAGAITLRSKGILPAVPWPGQEFGTVRPDRPEARDEHAAPARR